MVIKSFYITIENDLFYGKFDEIYEEWNLFVKSSNDVSEKGCQFKSRFPIHTLDEALRIMDNYINYVYYDNFDYSFSWWSILKLKFKQLFGLSLKNYDIIFGYKGYELNSEESKPFFIPEKLKSSFIPYPIKYNDKK